MIDKSINIDYQRFFDMAVDMLCVANFDGYFLHVNDAFTRVLGYSREELMSQPFVNFIHPDDIESTIAEAAKLSEGNIVHTFVNRYRHKDGSYRVFEWTSQPDLSQSLIYGTVRDITRFRQNQQQLIELKDSLEQQVKDRTQELNFHNASLNKLLDLASREAESLEENIESYLSMACELTGMETGAINLLEDGNYLAKYVFHTSEEALLVKGKYYSPTEALCHQVIVFDETVYIPNLTISSIKNHRACIESGIQSFIGTPIKPDEEQIGSLSFFSTHPQHLPFADSVKSVLEIMSRLLATKIKLSEVQEKLILSQQKYEELYHTAPDMMGSVDPRTGKFVAVNQSLASKFGHKVEEMIGKPVFDIYHPGSLENAKAAFQQFKATKQVHNVELQILDKDGKTVDVELNAKLVENESGEVLYSSSILRDISQRKSLERELSYSESRFRALAESMPIGICLLSQAGKIVYTNPAQSQILGYDRVDLQNAHFTDYIYKTDSIWNYDFLVRIIENKKSYSQEIELKHEEKESIWCKVTLAGMDPGPNREARVIITTEDITDQKRNAIALEQAYDTLRDTNEELQASNQELRFYQNKLETLNLKLTEQKQLLESGEQICKMSTWLFDPATGKTEYSNAYLEVHGFVGEEIDENNATAISISRIHPLDKAKMDHYREELKNAPLPLSETYRYIMSDGSIRWLKDTNARILPSGKILGTTQDITEEKHNQLALERQAEIIKQGENVSLMGSWILDVESGHTEFSAGYLQVHGFEPGEVGPEDLLQKCMARVHQDDLEFVEDTFDSIEEFSLPLQISYRYILPNGQLRWIQNTIGKKLDDGRLVGVSQDITQEKKYQEDLQESNQQLLQINEALEKHKSDLLSKQKLLVQTNAEKEILNHRLEKLALLSPAILYLYDIVAQQNIYANRSLNELMGYTEEEVQAMGNEFFTTVIHPEDLPGVFHHHTETLPNLQDSEDVQIEYRILDNNSGRYRWLSSTETVFERDENGNVCIILGIARDISVEKKAQEKARQANEELRKMVYSVSHDLRSPVRHIEGFSSILLERETANLSEKGKDNLNKVIYSAERLANMIEALLQYSRNQKVNIKPVKLNTRLLIDDLVESFTTANPKRELVWEIDSSFPEVIADKQLMINVWENLISNAIKYTSQNKISHIKIWGKARKYDILFGIEDDGVGFDMKYVDKLFTILQRLHTRSEFPGHGIGLANVNRIIELHAGKIWAEATLNKGAKFFFTLPKYPEYA